MARRTTNDVRQLRIFDLRDALQRVGEGGDIAWPDGGSVHFEVEAERLLLAYRYRAPGDAWQCVEQVIDFDRTPCHYGGRRPWFLCPHCLRRVAVLYGAGARFLCRHCYDLPYACQSETARHRLMRRARKIRRRLGASESLLEPIWDKPKGMRWKTFVRLSEAEAAAAEASMGMVLQRFR